MLRFSARPLPAADLANRNDEGERLEREREQEQTDHQRCEGLDQLVLQQRVHAMVDVDAAADKENADGRYQRPEEFLLTTTERMHCVGPPLPAHLADLQQNLVGDVGDRVDRFGEKSRRGGDEPAESFGGRDRRVGGDRD